VKTVRIKPMEIRDDRFPEVYAVVKELQDRGEDIPQIIRALLLREFLTETMLVSDAPVEKVLQAIASARRYLIASLNNIDLAEMRCRQLMGGETEAGSRKATDQHKEPVSQDEPIGAEMLEDGW
jgi:hypothetical protein